jgi:hypothetical protein
MIVSFLHKYIFIKTKKTAGTTIEWVLAQSCGPEDISTAVAPARRRRNKSTAPALADLAEWEGATAVRGLAQIRDKQQKQHLKAKLRANGDFHNHITAKQLRDLLPDEFWRSAFKFTAERHPYEKAVSLAYFQFNQEDRHIDSFDRLLDEVVRNGGYSGFNRWSIDGEPAVDDFIRQENLKADLARIGERLGIAIPGELPQLKGSARKDRRPAREILTQEQKRIVYEHCRREFEILGYSP